MTGGLPQEQITVVLTRNELLDALRSRPRAWKHQDGIRGVLVAVALVAFATTSHWDIVSTIGVLIILGLFYAIRDRLTVLLPHDRRARTYCFDTTGIDVAWGSRQRHYAWSQFRGTTRSHDAIVIWLNRRVAFVLPERCFTSPEQADTVAQTLDSSLLDDHR